MLVGGGGFLVSKLYAADRVAKMLARVEQAKLGNRVSSLSVGLLEDHGRVLVHGTQEVLEAAKRPKIVFSGSRSGTVLHIAARGAVTYGAVVWRCHVNNANRDPFLSAGTYYGATATLGVWVGLEVAVEAGMRLRDFVFPSAERGETSTWFLVARLLAPLGVVAFSAASDAKGVNIAQSVTGVWNVLTQMLEGVVGNVGLTGGSEGDITNLQSYLGKFTAAADDVLRWVDEWIATARVAQAIFSVFKDVAAVGSVLATDVGGPTATAYGVIATTLAVAALVAASWCISPAKASGLLLELGRSLGKSLHAWMSGKSTPKAPGWFEWLDKANRMVRGAVEASWAGHAAWVYAWLRDTGPKVWDAVRSLWTGGASGRVAVFDLLMTLVGAGGTWPAIWYFGVGFFLGLLLPLVADIMERLVKAQRAQVETQVADAATALGAMLVSAGLKARAAVLPFADDGSPGFTAVVEKQLAALRTDTGDVPALAETLVTGYARRYAGSDVAYDGVHLLMDFTNHILLPCAATFSVSVDLFAAATARANAWFAEQPATGGGRGPADVGLWAHALAGALSALHACAASVRHLVRETKKVPKGREEIALHMDVAMLEAGFFGKFSRWWPWGSRPPLRVQAVVFATLVEHAVAVDAIRLLNQLTSTLKAMQTRPGYQADAENTPTSNWGNSAGDALWRAALVTALRAHRTLPRLTHCCYIHTATPEGLKTWPPESEDAWQTKWAAGDLQKLNGSRLGFVAAAYNTGDDVAADFVREWSAGDRSEPFSDTSKEKGKASEPPSAPSTVRRLKRTTWVEGWALKTLLGVKHTQRVGAGKVMSAAAWFGANAETLLTLPTQLEKSARRVKVGPNTGWYARYANGRFPPSIATEHQNALNAARVAIKKAEDLVAKEFGS